MKVPQGAAVTGGVSREFPRELPPWELWDHPELTALARWLVLSTWFMSSDSFMSVTGLCSFFRSALYFTCRE